MLWKPPCVARRWALFFLYLLYLSTALAVVGPAAAGDLNADAPETAAEAEVPATEITPAEQAESWTPMIPKDDADWVELVSGEWLRGTLERFRDDTIEFDSDELDDQKFDYADVIAFRVATPRQFVHTDHTEYIGPAVMKDGIITVWTSKGPISFSRDELLGIVPTATRRLDLWDGKLSVGVSASSGNTDETNYSGFGYLRRSSAFTRLRFDYNGTVSFVNDSQNANNHRGTAKFDVFLSRRWYLTPAMIDVFSDTFQNIAMRITPSSSIGYHIFNSSKIEWDVELGAGAQITRLDNVAVSAGRPLEDKENLTGALIAATRVDWDITKRIDWTLDFRYQFGVPDVDERYTNMFTTLSFEITRIIDIDLSLKFNRNANPAPSGFENGSPVYPKSDDVTVTFGLGIDF